MAGCALPTVSNCCLGLADGRRYRNRRPEKGGEFHIQGIYAIRESANEVTPILYVGRGWVDDRLERHFKYWDQQHIGAYLSGKDEVDGAEGRFELQGIKVFWIKMCKKCTTKREEDFIQCVENALGYHPPFNMIAGHN